MAHLLKKLKPLISGLVIIAIIFSITFLFAPKEKQKTTKFYEENITKEIPEDGVHLKELVTISYVLTIPNEDNRVVDTNNAELAKKYGVTRYTEGPLRFIVGKSGKVKGFDDAIIGMRAGETKEIIIKPSEPATRYLLNKTKEFARNQPVPKTQVFKTKAFEALFGKKPILNGIFFNKKFPWNYKVINMSEEAVGLEAQVKEGQKFILPGLEWESTVLLVRNRDFLVRHNPKEGQTIKTILGPAFVNVTGGTMRVTHSLQQGQLVNYSKEIMGIQNPHVFKVMEVTDQKVLLERYDNPAEKKLLLNVTVLDRLSVIEKAE